MAQHEDLAAKAALKRQQQRDRLAAENVDTVLKTLTQHVGGRDFLWWLLSIGRVGHQPFTANALTTSFTCGELNVGQQIFARLLEVAPEGYILMLEEQKNVNRSNLADATGDPDGTGARVYDDKFNPADAWGTPNSGNANGASED